MTKNTFFETLNGIRAGRKMLTNSFLTRDDIESRLSDPNVQVLSKDGFLAFLSEEPEFYRLTYYSDGDAPLHALPTLLQNLGKDVVADITGRGDSPERQIPLFEKLGFQRYSKFVRMSANTITPLPYDHSICVEHVRLEEADDIRDMLYDEFDPRFSHIPHIDELITAIEKGEICGVYEGASLTGITYMEMISPKLRCLRYFLVRGEYRGHGIGSALLMRALSDMANGSVCYLWIGTYNETAVLYDRIGFREDGLVDHILVYHKGDVCNG